MFRGWIAWMMIKITHLGCLSSRTSVRENGSWRLGCMSEAGLNVVTNLSLLPVRSVFRADGEAPKLYRGPAPAVNLGRVSSPGWLRAASR